MKRLNLFLGGFLVVGMAAISFAQTTFYVSAFGTGDFSSANPGPLSGIIAKVRTVNTNMTGDIVINLRGGTYTLSSTWAFAAADGGTNGHNVIYQAYTGETPVISGGQKITGWTLADAGKNVYSSNVGTSIDTRQLYVNGVRATRARSTNGAGWSEGSTNGTFACPAEVSSWANINSVEVVLQLQWDFSRSKLSSVSGTTAYGTGYYVPQSQGVAWVENAYELLDAAGEWYLNRATGVLYYKPRYGEDMSTAEVILAKLETLISGSNVANLQFKGITFTYATWLYPNSNGYSNGQADVYDGWFDPKLLPGNISFTNSSYVRFENSIFTHLGSTAVRFPSGNLIGER